MVFISPKKQAKGNLIFPACKCYYDHGACRYCWAIGGQHASPKSGGHTFDIYCDDRLNASHRKHHKLQAREKMLWHLSMKHRKNCECCPCHYLIVLITPQCLSKFSQKSLKSLPKVSQKSLKRRWNQNMSQWVTEWQGHLLSCPGQLKKELPFKYSGQLVYKTLPPPFKHHNLNHRILHENLLIQKIHVNKFLDHSK